MRGLFRHDHCVLTWHIALQKHFPSPFRVSRDHLPRQDSAEVFRCNEEKRVLFRCEPESANWLPLVASVLFTLTPWTS
jgi:hypothetical protein